MHNPTHGRWLAAPLGSAPPPSDGLSGQGGAVEVWWERMLAAGPTLVATERSWPPWPRRDLGETPGWSDYQRAFGVRGAEGDPLNALHRLAFQRMFAPAWRAASGPAVTALQGQQVLRLALTAWRSPVQPSRVLAWLARLLEPEQLGRRACVLVITDPQCPHRAHLLVPQRLCDEAGRVRVEPATRQDLGVRSLLVDPRAETWTCAHSSGERWMGGGGAGGQLLCLPPHLLEQDPLPLVEPVTMGQRDKIPLSLALLSGSATSLLRPRAAPWWMVDAEPFHGPEGFLLELRPGAAFGHVLEVNGPYEFCWLEPGRGITWRSGSPRASGCDTVRVLRDTGHTRLQVRAEDTHRTGAIEVIQVPPGGGSRRSFRLSDVGLALGTEIEIGSDDGGRALTVACHGRAPATVTLELEAGWPGSIQRRAFPRLVVGAGAVHRFTPLRWNALGLGPIQHDVSESAGTRQSSA